MSWLDRLLERTQGLSSGSAPEPAHARLIDAAWVADAPVEPVLTDPPRPEPEPEPAEAETLEPEPPLELTHAEIVPEPAPPPPPPPTSPPSVFAVVMEFGSGEPGAGVDATLYCSVEGDAAAPKVSLNTTGDFSLADECFSEPVLAAARTLIATANSCLDYMSPTEDFPSPRPGWTRFYAFTEKGALTVELSFEEVGLARLSNAGYAVVLEMQQHQERLEAAPELTPGPGPA